MNEEQQSIGKKLGQYIVMSHIARGGMANVYLARDINLDREVALKVLLPEFTADARFVERFRREAKAVATIEHPNVVNIYTADITSDNEYYIAMEYVKGGSLADKMQQLARRRKMFTVGHALAVIRQMADALAVAHEAGIVHRDVKPSNILLRVDNQPVLTDLGIAAVHYDRRLTQTNVLMGTPDYMSPEQARGEDLDGRSDIYSLGVILYELLAGQRPFTADTPWTVLHQHIQDDPRPLSQLRPDLSAATCKVVDTCLRKNPEERYQRAEMLVEALDHALKVEGMAGQKTSSGIWVWKPADTGRLFTDRVRSATQAPSRWAEMNRLKLAYWLIPLLVVLIIVGLALRGGSGEERQTATPAVVAELSITPDGAPAPTNTPGPTSTLVPTMTSPPSLSAADLELLRPSGDERFGPGENIEFLWYWPRELADDQRFVLYVAFDEWQTAVDIVEAGTGNHHYSLIVPANRFIDRPGQYEWEIALEDAQSSATILRSQPEGFAIQAPTATPTRTPRPTRTPTRRPTNTPVPPTRVPVVNTPSVRPTNTSEVITNNPSRFIPFASDGIAMNDSCVTYRQGSVVHLIWAWEGELLEGQYLEVRIGPENEPRWTMGQTYGTTWTDIPTDLFHENTDPSRLPRHYDWQVYHMAADHATVISSSDVACIKIVY